MDDTAYDNCPNRVESVVHVCARNVMPSLANSGSNTLTGKLR